ncbi:T-cell activation inhibitor, mitochondrial-like isoform X2 [Babylonia areolata]|uniref:T-cell activation inhibitor, mitochondrial-like isoform X2 n=1 Tax=Babylonia areolata TaxID=304850 RepID=UPI003FD3982D
MLATLFRKSCRLRQRVACAGIMRYLTTQEVSAALRPFYFSVHPDLFGQFPNERAVNEDSLKQLSEYVMSLQVSGKARPIQLTFFVRQQDSVTESFSGMMKEVRVELREQSLRAMVVTLLQSCGLSLDYVRSIPVSPAETRPFRPIHWHPSYYQATGRADPNRRVHRPRPQLMLRTWLQLNMAQSRQKREGVRGVEEDIGRLCELLHKALGLKEIRWDSVWGVAHFRGCLKSFLRLYAQHPKLVSSALKGRSLLFSSATGVTRLGEIVLSSEDVPTSWMRLLASVGSYDSVLERLPYMEKKLSELLNNICIVRQKKTYSHVMAEDYELLLNKLLNSLRRCQDHVSRTFGHTDLSELQMVVDGENAPMTLTTTGMFLIPASLPGTLVVDFIQANRQKALAVSAQMDSCLKEEAESIERCVATLELLELSKDETVTPQQMALCCDRLTREYWRFCVSLNQSRLHVSHYYTVKQDGQICIPWDWVGEEEP